VIGSRIGLSAPRPGAGTCDKGRNILGGWPCLLLLPLRHAAGAFLL
jgi:hypothetical protein